MKMNIVVALLWSVGHSRAESWPLGHNPWWWCGGAGATSVRQAYEAARSACKWTTDHTPGRGILRTQNSSGVTTLRSQKTVPLLKCSVPASAADGEATLYIQRAGSENGPLYMEPGMWARWQLQLTFPQELWRDAVVHGTTFRAWSVNANTGEPLALPPLHNHHALPITTLTDHRFGQSMRGRYLTSAADYWCAPSEGGSDCLIRQLDTGFVWAIPADVPYTIIINDVRSSGGSYPLYYEIGVRVMHHSPGPTHTAVNNLILAMGAEDAQGKMGATLSGAMYHTFVLPRATPSLNFWMKLWPADGIILRCLGSHSHQRFLYSYHVFAGNFHRVAGSGLLSNITQDDGASQKLVAEPAGQREGEFSITGHYLGNRAAIPLHGGAPPAILEARMLATAERAGLRLLCSYRQALVKLPYEGTAKDATWDRANTPDPTPCDLMGHTFKKGEAVSGVCISNAMTEEAHQHCTFGIVYSK